MKMRAITLAFVLVGLAGNVAPANAAGTLAVTGPVVQALSVSAPANPRTGVGAPITYRVATSAWTTVALKVVDVGGDTVRTIENRETAGGTFTTSWDGKDAAGVAVADGDYTLIADPAGYVYDRTIGAFGSGAGELQQPIGSDVAPDGSLWIADYGHDRVVHFSADGTFLGAIPHTDPYSVHFDASGAFWVGGTTNVMVRYAPDGTEISRITLNAGSYAFEMLQSSTGNFFMVQYQNCCYWTVRLYSPTLQDWGTFGGYPNFTSITELPSGWLMSGSSNANLYAHNQSGGIPYGWGAICFATSCPGMGPLYGTIDVGASGGTVFPMYTRHQVTEVPELSNRALWAIGTGAPGPNHGQLQNPYGVSRDGDTLYISDYGNHRIEVYRRSAAVSTPISVDTTGPAVGGVRLSGTQDGGAILTLSADDTATGSSAVAGVEMFFDETAPDGTGAGLYAQDGSFDEATESAYAYLAPRDGTTRLYVHARDAGGNWGPYTSLDIRITGAPVSLSVEAAREVVPPGALDSGQRLTAVVMDTRDNTLDGRDVAFEVCPRGLSAAPCASGVATTEGGAATWNVPSTGMLAPGIYDVTATSGTLSAETTFRVLT